MGSPTATMNSSTPSAIRSRCGRSLRVCRPARSPPATAADAGAPGARGNAEAAAAPDAARDEAQTRKDFGEETAVWVRQIPLPHSSGLSLNITREGLRPGGLNRLRRIAAAPQPVRRHQRPKTATPAPARPSPGTRPLASESCSYQPAWYHSRPPMSSLGAGS